MKKISEDDMLAFVDGTLDADRAREVEEFLAHNEDEATLAHDMKIALDALHDWDAAEPVAVSAAFWPELREKLPAQPGRRGVRGVLAQWGLISPLGQPSRTLTFSARAAVVAAGVALLALFFAPQKATPSLSAEDKAFIQQSLKRHEAYELVQSAGGANLLRGERASDGRDSDGDGDDDIGTGGDDGGDAYIP
jgi:anti-sigma factor RsiW